MKSKNQFSIFMQSNSEKVSVSENGKLTIVTDHPEEEKGRIFIYKLSPAGELFNETASKDIYIAVPNGGCISVNNLPDGTYSLRKM